MLIDSSAQAATHAKLTTASRAGSPHPVCYWTRYCTPQKQVKPDELRCAAKAPSAE